HMASIPVLDHDAVLAAVKPGEAIERVREGFISFARGEWEMPSKVYLPSPPNGDFRAMPARGSGLALLKWVTSFPGNPRRGLPPVTGGICLSDAGDGEPLRLPARAAADHGPPSALDHGHHQVGRAGSVQAPVAEHDALKRRRDDRVLQVLDRL